MKIEIGFISKNIDKLEVLKICERIENEKELIFLYTNARNISGFVSVNNCDLVVIDFYTYSLSFTIYNNNKLICGFHDVKKITSDFINIKWGVENE